MHCTTLAWQRPPTHSWPSGQIGLSAFSPHSGFWMQLPLLQYVLPVHSELSRHSAPHSLLRHFWLPGQGMVSSQ